MRNYSEDMYKTPILSSFYEGNYSLQENICTEEKVKDIRDGMRDGGE